MLEYICYVYPNLLPATTLSPCSYIWKPADQLRYGGKSSNTMKITHQLLDLYHGGVKAGLDLRLNIWTRDGEEFFSFSRLPGSNPRQTRTRSRKWRRYGRARDTPENVRSSFAKSKPVQVDERSLMKAARLPNVEERSHIKAAGPPQVEEMSHLKVAGSPQVEERSLMKSPGPSQADERSLMNAPVPTNADARSQLHGVRPPRQQAVKTPENIRTPQRQAKKGKRRCHSDKEEKGSNTFLSSSPIPQIDGESDPELHNKLEPEPETELEPEPESRCEAKLIPPLNIINPIFGLCCDCKCLICPRNTTEKIGDFYACYCSSDASVQSCQQLHWHSKTNLCRTYI